jgi:CRP/FNR family transcriptional regulator, cyclic AMP receptor protein
MDETIPGGADLVRINAGKVLFKQGDAGDAVYLVLDGKVELRVEGRLVETVGPGGVLGEMALIEQAPRVATATAKTDADLLPISEARFMEMIQKTPHFALQIMKVMAARLRTMNKRMMAKKASKAKARASRPRAARRRSSRR